MRHSWILVTLVGAMLLSCGISPASAQTGFSPKAVDKAIDKAVQYLWGKQKADGSWGPYPPGGGAGHAYPGGLTALVAYALLESEEVNPQDPKMEKCLKWLERVDSHKTYTLGLRANVWLAADRKQRGKWRNHVKVDAIKLAKSLNRVGAYGYDSKGVRGGGGWDNSNSQYGLLGVWAAARLNLEVPRAYWEIVMRHWKATQCRDGGWPYRSSKDPKAGGSRATMTVAGIASCFVCFDNLYASQFVGCTGGRDLPLIKRGLDWLEKNFANSMRGINGYYFYGVERVGLASGYKYFGTKDWYKEGAIKLLKAQKGDGGWGSAKETAFCLLFLLRGRNPVIFNKLEFQGDWNNRPRDLATLTRWMDLRFERTLNWQIVKLQVPVEEWHDAPILYISGSKDPTFSDADIQKLRRYVLEGGLIFSCTECNGLGFKKGIAQTYEKMFPKYKLTEAKRDHPIYSDSVYFKLPSRVRFSTVSNGVRPLIIHCDMDLPKSWQLRMYTSQEYAFNAAWNVLMYTTGSIKSLRRRGETLWPDKPKTMPARKLTLARVKHGGRYDPEPLAHQRLRLMLADQGLLNLTVLPAYVAPADLDPKKAPLAALTGVGNLELSQAECDALKAYVRNGGTLVIDACGGDRDFAKSAERALRKAFGAFALRDLASSAMPYQFKGRSAGLVYYRPRTDKRLGEKRVGNLKGVLVDDRKRVGVIFSQEDITAGLLGYSSWSVDGYTPTSAYYIMRNICLNVAEATTPKPKPKPAKGGPKKPAPKKPAPKKKTPAKSK